MPNYLFVRIGFFFLLVLLSACVSVEPELGENETAVEVFFCPEDGCADHLIGVIDSANQSVHCAVYSFTLEKVADALVRAEERGVDVAVVFEKQQAGSQYSVDEFLEEKGVAVAIDGNSAYMHNKFCSIDGNLSVTGSFNWSKNGDEKNDENLVFIYSGNLARLFEEEFWEIWLEAETVNGWPGEFF